MAKTDLTHNFGITAIEMGLATKAQIKQATDEQKRLSDQGKNVLISDLLIEAGILSEEQRNKIIEKNEDLKKKLENENQNPSDIKVGKKVQNDSGFELTISEDKLEAFICPLKEDLPEVGIDIIKNLLETEGIKFGVVDDVRITQYLASNPSKDKLWKIAQGKAPDPGKAPEIKYHFDPEPLKAATVDENGNIDYKNRGKIPYVFVEDLLAEIIPGTDGIPGKDIYGEPAPPPEYSLLEILCGTGVKKIEEGNKAVADMEGRPELLNDGTINVSDELPISGDVGIETGHIEFDGHIKIKGTIQEGYKVRGKTVSADEILKAEVETTGEIIVAKGIIGANILTDGTIKARHIRDTTIDALEDVIVEKEVYESRIETNGIFDISRGTILGSAISAMKGIEAAEIGSRAATPSRLTVGIDNRLEKAIEKIRVQIEAKEKEKKETSDLLEKIKDLPEKLENEIGEKAQEQDLAMVKGRTLKKTLKSLQEAADRENMVKVVKIIKAMNAKLEQIGKDLDNLIKKQEKSEEKIASYKNEIEKFDTEIEELHDDIKSLLELAKMRKGSASVKASGTIYDRTFIKGKNASLTVRGDLNRVLIQEIEAPDKASENKWIMSVASL